MRLLKITKTLRHRLGSGIINESGALFVEAAFVLTLLMSLSVAVIDFGFFMAQKTRLEAINYSLASVLRERTYLYKDADTLTATQVDELAGLAKTMLGTADQAKYCLTVEGVTFRDGKTKVIATSPMWYTGVKGCKLLPARKLTTLTNLSPWSTRERWMPLYQVTLSTPVPPGAIHKMMAGVGALPETLIVSNVVLRR